MKTLPSQHLRYGDYREVLARVDALLFELVYKPVVDAVRPHMPPALRAGVSARALRDSTAEELRNAGDDALRRALRSGAVQVVRDPAGKDALFVVAKPDKAVSDALYAFGARIDRRSGVWRCAPALVPTWVRLESQSYDAVARAMHDQVRGVLDDIEEKIDRAVDSASMAKAADHAVAEVAGGWKASAKQLEVNWDLGAAGHRALAEEFAKAAKIPVKDWAKEAVSRMRDQVDENAARGYRAEGLADRIRSEYGVSKGRAELIARQETNNFMAAYRAARAQDAGLLTYVWTAVGDMRTRPLHKAHNGQVYRYDTPPVIDERTGQRGNPGQFPRCRCTDRPVLK